MREAAQRWLRDKRERLRSRHCGSVKSRVRFVSELAGANFFRWSAEPNGATRNAPQRVRDSRASHKIQVKPTEQKFLTVKTPRLIQMRN